MIFSIWEKPFLSDGISVIIQIKNYFLNRILTTEIDFSRENIWNIQYPKMELESRIPKVMKRKYRVSVFLILKISFSEMIWKWNNIKDSETKGIAYPTISIWNLCNIFFKKSYQFPSVSIITYSKEFIYSIHWLWFLIHNSLHGYWLLLCDFLLFFAIKV